MKAGCMDGMKFRRTARRLRATLGGACPAIAIETLLAGLLERLWQATAKSAPRGDIGRFADDEIAEVVGWLGEAAKLIELLVGEGWLDRHDVHRLVVHDWPEHAANWVKANNLRHRHGWAAAPQDSPVESPE